MIVEIIDIINRQLGGISKDESLFGVTIPVLRQQGTIIERMPGVVGADGEIKYAGIDDINSLMIYHRVNTTTTAQLRNGVGDSYGDIRNAFGMSAFVYWDRSKINMHADQIMLMLQSRMPLGITGLKDVRQTNIILTGANTNTYQIYQQEYASSEPLRPLPMHMHIMQLNYNIETTINPECYRQCPVCDPQ